MPQQSDIMDYSFGPSTFFFYNVVPRVIISVIFARKWEFRNAFEPRKSENHYFQRKESGTTWVCS